MPVKAVPLGCGDGVAGVTSRASSAGEASALWSASATEAPATIVANANELTSTAATQYPTSEIQELCLFTRSSGDLRAAQQVFVAPAQEAVALSVGRKRP